jgi:hypothetical protein
VGAAKIPLPTAEGVVVAYIEASSAAGREEDEEKAGAPPKADGSIINE